MRKIQRKEKEYKERKTGRLKEGEHIQKKTGNKKTDYERRILNRENEKHDQMRSKRKKLKLTKRER